MQEPIKVLLLENGHTDGCVANALLGDYDLDFEWRHVASAHELSDIAEEFAPDVVLCTNDDSSISGVALLEALRMLCRRPPTILVTHLHAERSAGSDDTVGLFLAGLREPLPAARKSASDAPLRYAQDLAQLRRAFSLILESTSRPVVMSDSDGWVTHANMNACRQLGADQDERHIGTLLGAPLNLRSDLPHWLDVAHEAVSDDDEFSGPFRSARLSPAHDDSVHRLAYFDAATGLPTLIHAGEVLSSQRAPLPDCAALPLVTVALHSNRIPDMGDAKYGDQPGASLTGRPGSIVRITENDFLLVMPPPCAPAAAAAIARQVLDGLAGARARTVPVPRIVREDNVRPNQREADRNSTSLNTYLGNPLERRALSVEYQPQYELTTGRGCGVEALARWVLSTGRSVSPSVFIPFAERCGKIHDLGAWILRSACETAVAWSAPRSTLSVNVSVLQINEAFGNVIQRVLEDSRFPANQLELEITESSLASNPQRTLDCLKEWKRLGVRIALDDFGTGYSSLNYLSRLPIDRLKVDQSLVHMMTRDSKSAAVMRSILSLGAELGIDVVAEGVETEQQFQMLKRLGCPRVQGYLLARPMPANQAQILLRTSWGNRSPNAGAAASPRIPPGQHQYPSHVSA